MSNNKLYKIAIVICVSCTLLGCRKAVKVDENWAGGWSCDTCTGLTFIGIADTGTGYYINSEEPQPTNLYKRISVSGKSLFIGAKKFKINQGPFDTGDTAVFTTLFGDKYYYEIWSIQIEENVLETLHNKTKI